MSPQSFQLVMRTGPTPGKAFPLSKSELTIGRDLNNDIVVNDAEISRKHARLVLQDSGYMLEDLGSTNGTFVDGQRLMGPYNLRPGDLVMFGENVSMSYEATAFDQAATMIAQPGQINIPTESAPPPPPPPPQPEPFQPAPEPFAPPPPAYSDQVNIPPGPAEVYPAPPPAPAKKGNRTWVMIGCGCLILVLCCVIVAAGVYWFDANNLYCQVLGINCPVP